jgi:thioredoxin reductase (NADPH)
MKANLAAVRWRSGPGGGRHPLETNRGGVFAIGDVRSGSTKRVAALHAYFARSTSMPLRLS